MGASSSLIGLCQPAKLETVVLSRCTSAASTCPCDGGSVLNPESIDVRPESALGALDYSFLGSAWTDAAALEKKLFSQGGLVVMHGMEVAVQEETSLAKGYEIRPRPLGWGSYGEVAAARHRTTGAKRAIKSVSKARLGPQVENTREYVRQEADVLRQLDHPNIVRLHEVFEDTANLYLVMELCHGGNLCNRLRDDGRPLNETESSGVLAQVLRAVRHMHARGLIHRDLKMENVVLASEVQRPWVEAPLVKLTDFGLTLRRNGMATLRLDEVAGTREYMAPEVITGKGTVPFADRADMWSLGILLYTMLTCKPPPSDASALLPEASELVRDLLSQLLRTQPENRPTAADASRHPFFSAMQVASQDCAVEAASSLSSALRTFISAPRMQRLALVAVSRASDDARLTEARYLFEALESECDGIVSREALEKARKFHCAALSPMIQSLLKHFEFVDVDGSGSIGWTEFVAVVLVAPDAFRSGGDLKKADDSQIATDSEDQGFTSTGLLQEDACRQAFEVLSQGNGLISGLMLGQLLMRADSRRWLPRMPSGHGGGNSRPVRDAVDSVVEDRSLAELDSMVRKVEPSGAIHMEAFLEMLKSVASPSAGAGKEELYEM